LQFISFFFEILEVNFMSQFRLILRGFSSQLIRARMFFAALGGVLFLSGVAQASLIPFLVNGPVNIGPNQFRYDYNIVLSADERVDPNATNGVTCPGPSNSNIQCNPIGTFVTLYDIPGLISASAASPFFSTEIQFLGPTPSSINGPLFDVPGILNVAFYYNGPVLSGPITFTGFSVVTFYGGLNPVGNFASQSTNNTPSSTNGTTDQVIGSVPLPSVPTAAAATIGGRITMPNGKGVSGVKVTITGVSKGESRTVLSGSSGHYSFADVEVGDTYVITVTGKHYTFAQSTQVQMVLDDRNDINFTAYAVKLFK
jgi:hypothetical protein